MVHKRMMAHKLGAIGIILALVVGAGVAYAQQPNDPRVSDLVRTGTLRAGLFLTQFYKDAATGEPRSVWVETARALAQRIGVRAQIIEHPTPEGAVGCLRTGAAIRPSSVGFPARPTWSSLGAIDPVEVQRRWGAWSPGSRAGPHVYRSGVRIAAVRNHASAVTSSGD